jgi:hypothetical protein
MTDVATSTSWFRAIDRKQWYTALIATNLGWLFDGFETYALVLTDAGVFAMYSERVFCQGLFSWMPAWLSELFPICARPRSHSVFNISASLRSSARCSRGADRAVRRLQVDPDADIVHLHSRIRRYSTAA